jgi:hypothetical protein
MFAVEEIPAAAMDPFYVTNRKERKQYASVPYPTGVTVVRF